MVNDARQPVSSAASERHRLASALFLEAADLTPEERTPFLDDRCGHDADLRAEVERFLRSDPEFLESPALGTSFSVEPAAPDADSADDATLVGRVFRGYRIMGVIASGGMGTVYEAEQSSPQRRVAIKVLRRGLISKSSLHRFKYEAEVLGRLHHPGIAEIYEAGTEQEGDGPAVPYFAMELIADAKPITHYVHEHDLDTRRRLELFTRVCEAVHHGHQRSIIHRDLKPSNILVDVQGVPKVIDFGVARATDSDVAITTLQTDVGQLIGTLQYMSPEQCEGRSDDLDTRCDVYSLGVVLYELLCDRAPYDVADRTVPEAIRIIREEPVTRPSTVNRTIRNDLETITLKALEKDRTRRYDSAAALAADVRRYAKDEPITARPPSAVYQLRKFARRNKGLVTGLAMAAVALVAGTTVAVTYAVREASARKAEAELRGIAETESLTHAAVNELLADIVLAMSPEEESADSRTETTRRVLESWATRLESAPAMDPLVRASLHQTLGKTYTIPLGMYAAASEHYGHAVALRREHLGTHHSDTLLSMIVLGQSLGAEHRHDTAVTVLREAVEVSRQHHGPRDSTTLHSTMHLVDALRETGKSAEALDLARITLDARRALLGEDHPDTIVTKRVLGSVLYDLDQYDEAIRLQREVLAWMEDQSGDEHANTLQATQHLGLTLLHASPPRLDEAGALLEEAASTAVRTLGPDHPSTLAYRGYFADCLYEEREFDESETILREVLRAEQAQYGDEHLTIARTLHHLARVRLAQGEIDEARALARKAVSIYETYPEAAATRHLHALQVLWEVYFYEGRFDELMEVGEEIVRFTVGHFGESDQRTLTARGNIGSAYQSTGKPAQAEPHFRAVLPVVEALHGPDHRNTIVTRNNLAASLRDQGKYEEAAAFYRDVCERAPHAYAANDPTPWMFQSGYGFCLYRLERFEEAERVLLEAEERLAGTMRPDHPWTKLTRERLGELYDAWGKPARAAEWRAIRPAAPREPESDD